MSITLKHGIYTVIIELKNITFVAQSCNKLTAMRGALSDFKSYNEISS